MRASSLLIGLTALPVAAFASLNPGTAGACLYLLSDTNQLATLSDSSPAQTSPPLAITGVTVGESLVAIDVRPINQQLYGLGVNTTNDTIQLYCISSVTGTATPVGSANGMTNTSAVKIQLDATRYGIDFNPAADRLRVVTSSGVSFRVNPTTGACVDTDGNAGNGINPDGAINGATTTVGEAAYTNNVPDNGNVTTLYTIDSATDSIYIQNPPNNGTQTSAIGIKVGGIPLNFTTACGFDIPVGVNAAGSNAAATGFAYAVLESGSRRLYRLNLSTGDATQLSIPSGIAIRSLAVSTQVPVAICLNATANNLVRVRRNTPTTTTTQALNLGALAANETLVGIDYRPATGQLYGLAINSTDNNGSLYLIEPMSGAVSLAVGGTQGAIQFVNAVGAVIPMPPASDGYGMDFNPTVDRLRVTSGNAGGAGINFRVNPVTGFPVDGNLNSGTPAGVNPDGPLNGPATGATSCAYTNSFGQPLTGGTTTLYSLDPATDSLYIMNPASSGTLTSGKLVKLNGVTLNFTAASGFDITQEGATNSVSNVPSPGDGWAALTVGGVTGLYRINLRTAEATAAGNIGTGTGVMVGLAAAGEAGPGYGLLTWNSTIGAICRIETSTDLANWQPFGGPVTATATTTTVPVPFYNGDPRRFWRAILP
ncbi:DUF4394 domain-containing protein [Luteolibacter arcticus]|uniref:DUF4394 domain-containing protein n=1 Tax=Luteolibacter arcticus TaxID=1581411 RepID=A0ABT3GE55_9BACT|nr:DUF4394 domain-containing protein [Luteolibacter arcticus]MCW1921902.1 DUF4394 domain-containing protein [Luteolibacter arcticus]